MRIIAGSARGLRLKAPPGKGTRPTSDRARETLFNVIAGDLPDASVLDLFAGTGALGLEALSRGARSATFVERERAALAALRANLEHTRLNERATVVAADWRAALRRLAATGETFDLILIDPPWSADLGEACLEGLGADPLVAPGALAVLEHPTSADPTIGLPWRRFRSLAVGDTAFALCECGVRDADPC